MATVKLNVPSKVKLPIAIGCCADVLLCLSSSWEGSLISGIDLLPATIDNTGRSLSPDPAIMNVRCNDVYQYAVSYDNTLVSIDQRTGEPYEILCSDIIEIFPYACVGNTIIDYIDVLPDWVVDSDNVTQTVDVPTRQFDVEIPIIDRVNQVGVGVIQLDFSALFDDTATDIDDFGDTAAGGYTVTKAAILGGGTQVIQVISQDANNLVVPGTDNGAYVPPQGVKSELAVAASATTAIDSGGPFTIYTSGVLTLTNSDPNRAKEFLVVGDNTLQATLLDTGVWIVSIEEDFDGGGYATVASATWGPYAPVGAIINQPMVIPLNVIYTVPAASSVTIQRRIIVTVSNPSGVGSQITAYALGMRAIGVGI